MNWSPLRISKVAALATAVLMILLVTSISAIRVAAAHEPGMEFTAVPVFVVYLIVGGVLWVVGSTSAKRAQAAGERGARLFYWLNQSYPALLAIWIGWALIVQLSPGG